MIDKITAGYLECAAWADAPEGSHARFTAAARADAAAVCAAFVQYVGPVLTAQALQLVEPEQFGHDLWLTRCGHGAGFWDRDALDVPPDALPLMLDRDARPMRPNAHEVDTLAGVLTLAARGSRFSISPFACANLRAYRGWLTFDCDSAVLELSGRVHVWAFWKTWQGAAA